MSGIEAMRQPTPEQLEAMYGGETLRGEASFFTQVKNVRKSTQRLKDALQYLDLAVPLCLLVAQQKNYILYHINDAHMKLLGRMYDLCQDTLLQFGQFLLSNFSPNEHRLPPVSELLANYSIKADVAFFLARPCLMEAINVRFQLLKRQATGELTKIVEERLYVTAVNYVLSPLSEAIKPLYPAKCWQDLSSELFVTFWTLSMGDVETPVAAYQRESDKLRAQIAAIDDNHEMALARKKKERDRHSALLDRLADERRRQDEHVSYVMARLRQDKDSWFISHTVKNDTITQFLQLCLFPRCRFSSLDALYCARFVHTLHKLKTSQFSTLICFDKIFCDITYTVASCTEAEAHRYGLFLGTLMGVMMRWHGDKRVFDQECSQYPGFVTRFKGASSGADSGSGDNDVDYENYRHVCHKWHYKLTKALVLCLESDNDVQLKNGLIVLTQLVPHFPRISHLFVALEKRVIKLKKEERDNRKDVYSLASMYSGQLKLLKPQCVDEREFHHKEHTERLSKRPPAVHPVTGSSSNVPSTGVGGSTNQADTKVTGIKIKDERSSVREEQHIASSSSLLVASGSGATVALGTSVVPLQLKSGVKREHPRDVSPSAGSTSAAQVSNHASHSSAAQVAIAPPVTTSNEDEDDIKPPRRRPRQSVAASAVAAQQQQQQQTGNASISSAGETREEGELRDPHLTANSSVCSPANSGSVSTGPGNNDYHLTVGVGARGRAAATACAERSVERHQERSNKRLRKDDRNLGANGFETSDNGGPTGSGTNHNGNSNNGCGSVDFTSSKKANVGGSAGPMQTISATMIGTGGSESRLQLSQMRAGNEESRDRPPTRETTRMLSPDGVVHVTTEASAGGDGRPPKRHAKSRRY